MEKADEGFGMNLIENQCDKGLQISGFLRLFITMWLISDLKYELEAIFFR